MELILADDLGENAGAAAMTLLDCLITHLQEATLLSEADRDEIYESAIQAHDAADQERPAPRHQSIVRLLKRVQTRSDGITVIGVQANPSVHADRAE